MQGTASKFFFVGVMIALTMVVGNGPSFSRGTAANEQDAAQETGSVPPLLVLATPPPPFTAILAEEKKTFNASTLLTTGIAPLVGSGQPPPSPEPRPFLVAGGADSQAEYENATTSSLPRPTAHAALIADLVSGEEYFSMNDNRRWPLASLTKLMTAVVVSQEMDMEMVATLREEDFILNNVRRYFAPGDRITVEDLFRTMLIASSNEAAEALARTYGRAAFVNRMNLQAATWGLTNTHFDDPTGLSVANQSTIGDLKRLTSKLSEAYPRILRITREPQWFIVEQESSTARSIGSTNAFAGRVDFLGGKTGYTDEADGNLLSLFSYEDRQVLVIVLGTGNRFQETEKLLAWYKHTHP